MDRKTVKSRIDAGYDPIDISLEKWRELEKRWQNLSGRQHRESCALCHVHLLGSAKSCNNCPLCLIGDMCDTNKRRDSFCRAVDTKNASIMVTALLKAKEYMQEHYPYTRPAGSKAWDAGVEILHIGDRFVVEEEHNRKLMLCNIDGYLRLVTVEVPEGSTARPGTTWGAYDGRERVPMPVGNITPKDIGKLYSGTYGKTIKKIS